MQIVILISLILISLIYIRKNVKKMNFFIFFIFSNLLFFGLYPLSDILRESYVVEIDNFVIIYSYILISVLIVGFCYNNFLSSNEKEKLEFTYLNELCRNINNNYLYSIYVLAFTIVIYFFLKYNFLFRVVVFNNPNLNLYSTVIQGVVLPLLYIVEIITINKIFSTKKSKSIMIFILFSVMAYFLFYGRREFILGIFIFLLIFNINKGKNYNLFSVTNIPKLLIIGFFIIIASNFYQNIRGNIFSYSVTKKIEIDKPILDLFFDFESSNKNLDERGSLLSLLNVTVENVNKGNISNGVVISENFKTAIPSFLNSNKKSINEDALISKTFNMKSTDYSACIASLMLMDFSYLAFIFYPMFIFFTWKFSLFLFSKITNKLINTFLLTLLILNAFTMEGSMASSFLFLRTLIFIWIIYLPFRLKNY